MNKNNCPILRRNLNNKTSVCIEEQPLTEGETYILMVTGTNEVGLSFTAKSTQFIIDTTEPDVGEVIIHLIHWEENIISSRRA